MKAGKFLIFCFVFGLVIVAVSWAHNRITASTPATATTAVVPITPMATITPITPTTATTESTVGAWTPTTPGAMPPPDTTPTPPTPEPINYTAVILSATKGTVGDRAMSDQISYSPIGQVANVAYQSGNAFSLYTIQAEIVKVAKAVVGASPDVQTINIDVYSDATDKFGNTKNEIAISTQFKRATVDEINSDNFDPTNLPRVADFYKEMIKF